MTEVTGVSLRSIVLLTCLVVWPSVVAGQTSSRISEEELAKQAGIYKSRGEDVPKGYVIGRSLLSYGIMLTPEFHRALASLDAEDRWLDVGAGEGRAVLDYCTSKYDVVPSLGAERSGEKAQAVAMSIEDRRTSRWHDIAAMLKPKQVDYLFGRRLHEYSAQELGKFQLISDVLGGFSYTRFLSMFMERALGILEVNGDFFTVLQDVHSEAGMNRPFYPGAAYLTEITQPDGSSIKICSWLKSVSCVEVTCELYPETSPPIEVYRIRKMCNDVRVPNLDLVHFEAGTPPERRFVLRRPRD